MPKYQAAGEDVKLAWRAALWQRALGWPALCSSNVAEEVVLINAFEVPVSDAEDFIAAWEKARDYLRTQPGYIDTALHQAVTPGADFEFVNIARWRSPGDFTAAVRNQEFQRAAADLAGYRSHPALYRAVRT
jgi:heme-degrading monooxygenase HmoA